MNKIKHGDEVAVLCGAYKGRRGEVKRVILDGAGKPARVVVEGINMRTNFERPNPQQNEPGGRILREAPIHVSNVALVDSVNGRYGRVKIIQNDKGKTRIVASADKEVL